MERKKKKRTKEKKEGYPIKGRKEVKNGKEAILNQWKRANERSSYQINFRQGK